MHPFQVKQLAFQGNSYLMEVTALSEAALHGNHNIVQLLVESKAEVNAISPVSPVCQDSSYRYQCQ